MALTENRGNAGRNQTQQRHYTGTETRNEETTAKAKKIMEKFRNPETKNEAFEEMYSMVWHSMKCELKPYEGFFNANMGTYEDLEQQVKIEMFLQMENYNPDESSPAKYFKTHALTKALSEMLYQNTSGVTQHYQQMAKKITRLEQQYGEELVQTWSDEKISDLTDIPVNTVRETRSQMHISHESLDADETREIRDEFSLTPEEAAIQNERHQVLADALNSLDYVNQVVFVQVALQDNTNWADAVRQLEEDQKFMSEVGKEKLSTAFVQTQYDIARRQLNMQRSVRALRATYDLRDEEYLDDYDFLEEVFDDDVDPEPVILG